CASLKRSSASFARVDEPPGLMRSGVHLVGGVGEMTYWKCPRCMEVISADDTVQFVPDGMSHVDCQRPRDLSPEERALLFLYCCGHAAAMCVACSRTSSATARASARVVVRTFPRACEAISTVARCCPRRCVGERGRRATPHSGSSRRAIRKRIEQTA